MHRHLLGLTSPPADHLPDRSAMPLDLPELWDGDVWVKANGQAYFLRAWCVTSGRVAYGVGAKFQEARRALMAELVEGNRWVKVMILESKPV